MWRLRPELFFVGSAVFHYLGSAFAVLLFVRVEPLGVAWLRILSAGVVFALWRRPWRSWRLATRHERRTIVTWGVLLALMNTSFYLAIDRLPLGTVAAIEFVGPVAVAAAVRTSRNLAALLLAVADVAMLAEVTLAGSPSGFTFATINMVLFTGYIVVAHRVSRHDHLAGIDGLAMAMLVAAVAALPIGVVDALPALTIIAVAIHRQDTSKLHHRGREGGANRRAPPSCRHARCRTWRDAGRPGRATRR